MLDVICITTFVFCHSFFFLVCYSRIKWFMCNLVLDLYANPTYVSHGEFKSFAFWKIIRERDNLSVSCFMRLAKACILFDSVWRIHFPFGCVRRRFIENPNAFPTDHHQRCTTTNYTISTI